MIQRQLSRSIQEMEGKYPVITITGPRQSGKTTLLKSLYPDWPYFSMETPDVREMALRNPRELFARHGHRLVLDEVQRTPDLLSYIQTIVDEDAEACFILSGSHNLLMLEKFNIQHLVPQGLVGAAGLLFVR